MAITPLPTLDRTSPTFKSDVDTFFGSQLPAFAAEANSLQADVTAKQGTASSAAATADTKAWEANASADAAWASRLAAQGYSDATLGYKNEANASKNAAADSATAANTSAGIASTKADEAAASAASIAGGPVASWAGLTGIISESQARAKVLASPALTGTPTTPTQATTDNSTQVVNSSWVRTSMGNIASAAGFSASLVGTDGYIKFPSWLGGVILQWGRVITWNPISGAAVVSFPMTFPSACRAILPIGAGGYDSDWLYASYVNWASVTTSAVEIFLRKLEGVSGVTPVGNSDAYVYWFAIGY